MARTRNILFLGLMGMLMFTSCDNSEVEEDFPTSIGIKGKVMTQNEFQQPLYSERDGISVLLEVGFRSFPVDADNTGNYVLGGAPVGTYAATYSKEGFGTVSQRGLKVSTVNPEFQVQDGAQVLPTVTLTKIPNTTFDDEELTLDYVVLNETDTVYDMTLFARIVPAPPPTGQPKGYRLFIDTDPLVSPSNYLYQSHYTTLTDTFGLHFDQTFFNTVGITSGDMVYAVLYGDANFDLEQNSPTDSLTTFPNLSPVPSEVTSIALP